MGLAHARRIPTMSVGMYPRQRRSKLLTLCARMCQSKSVRMFLPKFVRTFQSRNVLTNQMRSAKIFQENNATMNTRRFLSALVEKFQSKFVYTQMDMMSGNQFFLILQLFLYNLL